MFHLLRSARLALLVCGIGAALASGAVAQTAPDTRITSACGTPGTCSALTAGTAAVQLIAAPQTTGLRLWLGSGDCVNTGAATSLITLTSGAGGPVVAYGIAQAGGGWQFDYHPALPVAPNTALYFTAGTASTSVYCTRLGLYRPLIRRSSSGFRTVSPAG